MWEVLGVVIAILALIISLLASAFFYFKSARQLRDSTQRLQRTMNVLGQYLKTTIKNADVDLNINKEGDVVGLNITLHPDPINVQVQVSEVATLVPDLPPLNRSGYNERKHRSGPVLGDEVQIKISYAYES